MSPAVRALRGATTLDNDTAEEMEARVQALLREMLDRNGVAHDDIVSIVFTATDDLHAMFPATAARGMGLGVLAGVDHPHRALVDDAARAVHLTTDRAAADLRHVYLEKAKGLNDELRT